MSMLKAQVIGVGAAGNKAALALIKTNVIDVNSTMLVNSTMRDIPNGFQGKVVQIGNSTLSGCGKERSEGKRLALEALQSGKLNLDSFIDPLTDIVIIVTSTEGGTGSGASVIIAQYLKKVLHCNVHIFAFTGFEEDARGLYNTVEFFKDLDEEYTVQIVRNKKFLQEANNNFSKAETMANTEFATRISILLGNPIVPSDQNIDKTDLFKISTTPGYMDIQYKEISEKVKNVTRFNEIIKDMIDESKGMDIDNPSQTLMGVIINIPESERGSIDYDFKEIVEHYGFPFEKFRHIQSKEDICTFIAFVCAGMKIPIKEIEDVYDKYVESTSKVDKKKDDFRSFLSDLTADETDSIFNLRNRNKAVDKQPSEEDKDNFFKSFNLETPNVPKNNSSNKIVKPKDNGMKNY